MSSKPEAHETGSKTQDLKTEEKSSVAKLVRKVIAWGRMTALPAMARHRMKVAIVRRTSHRLPVDD
jgi:hypothetical protein